MSIFSCMFYYRRVTVVPVSNCIFRIRFGPRTNSSQMRRTISSYSRRQLVWHENGSAYHTEKIHRIYLIQLHNISRSRSSRFWFRLNYCKQALLWEWTLDNEIQATNFRTHKLTWSKCLVTVFGDIHFLPYEIKMLICHLKAVLHRSFLLIRQYSYLLRPSHYEDDLPLTRATNHYFFFNALRERNLRSIRNSLVRWNEFFTLFLNFLIIRQVVNHLRNNCKAYPIIQTCQLVPPCSNSTFNNSK